MANAMAENNEIEPQPTSERPSQPSRRRWWIGPVYALGGALLALGGVAIRERARVFGLFGHEVAMKAIPAGDFEMGTNQGEPDESPPHRVSIKAFRMDQKEVTVAQYQTCVQSGACSPASTKFLYCNSGKTDRGEHPINCVDFTMATTYCKWRHARLPSEAEWEYVARGKDGRTYPWGNEPPLNHACYLRGRQNLQTCPVGANAPDSSPFGVVDMGGNVSEWTSTQYCSYTEPTQCKPGSHVTRGGAWNMENPMFVRSTFRDWVADDRVGFNLGFRCAADK